MLPQHLLVVSSIFICVLKMYRFHRKYYASVQVYKNYFYAQYVEFSNNVFLTASAILLQCVLLQKLCCTVIKRCKIGLWYVKKSFENFGVNTSIDVSLNPAPTITLENMWVLGMTNCIHQVIFRQYQGASDIRLLKCNQTTLI